MRGLSLTDLVLALLLAAVMATAVVVAVNVSRPADVTHVMPAGQSMRDADMRH